MATIEDLQNVNILPIGAVGKTFIFQRLHNKIYRRSYFRPQNPKSAIQQVRRSLFHVGVRQWQTLTPEEKKRWRNIHIKGVFYNRGFNAFMSVFMKEGVEMAVKKVVSGYVELVEGIHDVPIEEVDASRSVLLWNPVLAGSLAGRNIVFWGIVYAYISSDTTIRVKVLQSAVDEPVPFSYSVIEFV